MQICCTTPRQQNCTYSSLEQTYPCYPNRSFFHIVNKKYRLLTETVVDICKISGCETLVNKVLNSSFLRKWYTVRINLNENDISLKSSLDFSYFPIPYSKLINIKIMCHYNSYTDCLVKIAVPDGFIILKMQNLQIQNQFMHSLAWKRKLWHFAESLKAEKSFTHWSNQIKDMVAFTKDSALMDVLVQQKTVNIVAQLILENVDNFTPVQAIQLLLTTQWTFDQSFPLGPSSHICKFFVKYPKECCNYSHLQGVYFDLVEWTLKHNVNFSHKPSNRALICGYINNITSLPCCLNIQTFIDNFVNRIHGPLSKCPHRNCLRNLFSVCIDVINHHFNLNLNNNSSINTSSPLPTTTTTTTTTTTSTSFRNNLVTNVANDDNVNNSDNINDVRDPLGYDNDNCGDVMNCGDPLNDNDGGGGGNDDDEDDSDPVNLTPYYEILIALSKHYDWLVELAGYIQLVPFSPEALSDVTFLPYIKVFLRNIVVDKRCSVHQSVIRSKLEKPGWLDLSSTDWSDDDLHSQMLGTLLDCCCYRRKFFKSHSHLTPHWSVMAANQDPHAIKALCGCLEFEVVQVDTDLYADLVSTLSSTQLGQVKLDELNKRLDEKRIIQNGSGPRKLSLPSRATDLDLKRLLESGCYGNVEALSLAFTKCTALCAQDIIHLTSLRELNLWSTQFTDTGLQLISDHLDNLEVLNLCETLVTSQGILCLASLKNLRKVNLNSTAVSLSDYEKLKELLPNLEEVDIKYTDAWLSC